MPTPSQSLLASRGVKPNARWVGSGRDRFVAERAAFLAADLLERGVAGSLHPARARWLYSRAGEAGARRLRSLPAPVRVVNGLDASRAVTAPLGLRVFAPVSDASEIASRIFAQPMLGKLYFALERSQECG